ncbi:pyridoxal 5'-phosphate synthase glutaminase subunit PdxT [Candidatus Micrarchaeota archaeon]|nr:pyridoxal 5'-phosphate synthase glutaminase subunit PdxT [Candidatus Micrarchaeota archaeon]MBU2477118.1 pyridoxal 5'-phosphate synthase glutaminase subunit PdxT [Candidatus Micrarchaeota archaeon]
MIIGILALQGDFAEHKEILDELKVQSIFVTTKEELEKIDGLIIPGGESTTIGKLLKETGLGKKIILKAKKGLPVFGTCAGAIVLAKKIAGKKEFSLNLLDIAIERNAFGRQNDSFDEKIKTSFGILSVSFIRAPKIKSLGKKVEVLAKRKKEPVIVRQGKILAATCHPEIYSDTKLHEFFLEMIKK